MPPPGDWDVWFGCTGRGTGKNLVLSKFLHEEAYANPGCEGFMAARTRSQVISAIISHPECGVLVTQSPLNPCQFKQKRGVWGVYWANGAYAGIQTAEEPEGGRGGHYAFGVADEIATWKRKVDEYGATLWENLQLALRAGDHPRMFAASTPRPVELVRELLKQGEDPDSGTVVYRESLLDNAANHPASYVRRILKRYKGTRLYRQEVEGELLNDLENAILTADMLNADRVEVAPDITRYMIGVDPTIKKNKATDKCGIVVDGRGVDDHLYTFENRSFKGTPTEWGNEVVRLSFKYENATIAPEDNQGGLMIGNVLEGCAKTLGLPMPRVLYKTADKKKHKRAEPILGYHERHEAHMVGSSDELTSLEDQLCLFTASGWEGEGSPDDADAHVWAGTELMLNQAVSFEDMARLNAS